MLFAENKINYFKYATSLSSNCLTSLFPYADTWESNLTYIRPLTTRLDHQNARTNAHSK